MDGKVSIQVELLTNDLDKEIAEINRKLKKFENDEKKQFEKDGVKYSILTSTMTKEEADEYNKLIDKHNQLIEKKAQLAREEEKITNQAKIRNIEEDKTSVRTNLQQRKINELTERLQYMITAYRVLSNSDIVNDQDVKDAKSLKKDINDTVRMLEKLTGQSYHIKGITDANNELGGIASKTENVIKKVGRWALAVFGIRSAYMFIRQSMSTLSQYNEKIGADIQYLRFALASALQHIIETIINLVYKLLAYINYIAQAWFGVNLFANATVKAFQKVNKGVKDTNKSAKQLQKTLAGFDEMNILQDTGATSTGGGGGGITNPSYDLSNFKNIEIPGWVEWIATHKDTIIEALKQIASLFVMAFAIKGLLEFTDGISKIKSGLESIGKLLGGMSSLQIFSIIMGVALTIWGIIETIQVLSSETVHLEDLLGAVGDAIIGIGLITAAFTPWGWVEVGIGLLANLVSAFIDTRTDAEKLEEANKNLADAQEEVNKKYKEYVNANKKHLNAFKNAEEAEKKLKEISEKLGYSQDDLERKGYYLFNTIRDGTLKIGDLSDEDKELYEAFLDHLDAQANLKTATDDLTKSEKELSDAEKIEIQRQLDQQDILAKTTDDFNDYRDAVIDAYEQGAISGEDATERLTGALLRVDKDSKQTFVDGIPGYIQGMFSTFQKSLGGFDTQWRTATDDVKIYTDSLAGKFNSRFGKDIPNSVQKSIDKVKSLTNILSKIPFGKSFSIKVSSSLSGSGNAKGAIYYPPKLAVGGIINQPGRGVPLAMGGERGAEGVIPLTDAQQMQRLGEAIGRYIVINANITNTMNGRVISRELQQIQNESDFAFNR